MTLQQIRQKAKTMGVKNITRHKKDSLIKAIQEQEGNSPCFRGIEDCWEERCLWREECQADGRLAGSLQCSAGAFGSMSIESKAPVWSHLGG